MSLVPIFASLLLQRPIPVTAGLPHLQPDLKWDEKCPLHVMGAFAQLQLGADALNLAGARSGGVIVAKSCLQAEKQVGDLQCHAIIEVSKGAGQAPERNHALSAKAAPRHSDSVLPLLNKPLSSS